MDADHRPDIYLEDDRWVMRASSFGACDGSLVRTALGIDPDAKPQWLQDKMDRSAELEEQILRALGTQGGWRMLDGLELEQWGKVDDTGQLAGELVVPSNRFGGIIRCHPDGIARRYKAKLEDQDWPVGSEVVVEVKALSAKGRKADVLAEHNLYRWQTSIEMAVTGLPMLFVAAWKDEDGNLVTGPTGLELTVVMLRQPFYTRAEINARFRSITRQVEACEGGGALPACTWAMYPCGHWATHDTETGVWMKKEATEVKGATRSKLRSMAIRYADAKAREDQARRDREQIGAAMVELCGQEDLQGKLNIGAGFKVERVVKAGSRRFQKDLAYAKWGQEAVDACYVAGKPSDYMSVEVEG